MSTTAAKPATTPIPVQLSDSEFTAFILPHLSIPKRGPKCKLGYHRIFNLILWILYTGMQWQSLPVPKDANGKPAIHFRQRGCLRLQAVLLHWAQRRQCPTGRKPRCPEALGQLTKRFTLGHRPRRGHPGEGVRWHETCLHRKGLRRCQRQSLALLADIP
jgi:hypothetical protein